MRGRSEGPTFLPATTLSEVLQPRAYASVIVSTIPFLTPAERS